MSEYLGPASQKLGAPEDIVMRSAQARATADGLTVDDILRAWAGGTVVASVAVASAPPLEVEAEADVVAPEPQPAPTATTPKAQPAPAAVAPQAPPAPAPIVVEIVVEEEEPLEVPPLRERARSPAALGSLVGLILGLAGLLLASPWLIGAGSSIPGEDPSPAWLVSPFAVVVAAGAISIIFGGLVAVLARSLPTYAHPGARLVTSTLGSFGVGAVVGVLLGAAAAAVLLGALGESLEITVEGEPAARTLLPMLESLLVILVGGAALGAASAVAPHVVGMPVALRGEAAEEPTTVRRRMSTAVVAPVTAVIVIGVLVVSFSRVLLAWPQFAPVVATLMAVAILGFGSLLRMQPGTRLRRGDVYAAISGIAVIFIVIIAVLVTFVGTDEPQGEEGGSESGAVVRLF
ncbi:MAG TPA: hypothetical protein VIL12_03275 [Acidimicrobiia bacterium]